MMRSLLTMSKLPAKSPTAILCTEVPPTFQLLTPFRHRPFFA
jgi:hypothetical protein